jgi:hypothetical protein
MRRSSARRAHRRRSSLAARAARACSFSAASSLAVVRPSGLFSGVLEPPPARARAAGDSSDGAGDAIATRAAF